MQTLIIEDKDGEVMARVVTRSCFVVNSLDELIQMLMDEGVSIRPFTDKDNTHASN